VRGMLQSIYVLTGEQLVIGIPENNSPRSDSGLTNAELGYIHERGAPGANIPARPFLVPGVRKAVPFMLPHLKRACNFALDMNYVKAHKALEQAGSVAERFVKREIMTGNFAPLQPSTIANRFRGRGVSGPSRGERRYLTLIGLGASPQLAQDAVGIHPLINSRQLYNSIGYAVRRVFQDRWVDKVVRAINQVINVKGK